MHISRRAHHIQASPIRKLKPLCRQGQGAGDPRLSSEHRRPRRPDAAAGPRRLPRLQRSRHRLWPVAGLPRAPPGHDPVFRDLRHSARRGRHHRDDRGVGGHSLRLLRRRRSRRRYPHPRAVLHELQRLRLVRLGRASFLSPSASRTGFACRHRKTSRRASPRGPRPSSSARPTIRQAPFTPPRSSPASSGWP